MSKKIIGIIAILLVIGIAVIVFVSKSNPGQKKPNNQNGEPAEEVTQESLDASIASTIEKLKSTCSDFLAGDINDASNCPALDNPMYQNICHYCFAVKNQDSSLCVKISDPAFYAVCQKATEKK
jgi:hypothetical protein